MGFLKVVGYLGVLAFLAAGAEAAIARQTAPEPSFPDRVDELCRREFSRQIEQAFLECKFNLLGREALLGQDQKEGDRLNRLDRLYREAR